MSHPTPEDEREWLELSTGVRPVATPRTSSGPPAAPAPHLTNGVPIHERPPLRAGDHATIAGEIVAHELDGAKFCEERFWRYDGGLWRDIPDGEVNKVLIAYSGRPYQNGKGVKDLVVDRGDVTGTLACAKDILRAPDWFDGVSAGCGFKNGFLGIVGGTIGLREPSPEHRIRAAHAFDFDPRAPRTELDAFFDVIFADDSEDEGSAKRGLLQEFFGAAMFGLAPSFQKCLVMYGRAGNGKSQILEILSSVFPDSSVISSLPPHMWGEQFALEGLAGKLVNLVDELPKHEIVSGAAFKAVITGNPVAAERKYQAKFTFRPRAAHVFCTNELPATADTSEAFFDRFILLGLRRKIRDTGADVRDAGQRVIAACRPGIVAWATEGAQRLLARGRFELPESSAKLLADWRLGGDSVAMFFAECTADANFAEPIGLGNGTKAMRLYQEYRTWCGDNGFKVCSSKTFAQRAESMDRPAFRREDANYYPVHLRVSE